MSTPAKFSRSENARDRFANAAPRSKYFGFRGSHIIFLTVSVLTLFLGFYRNQWNAARDKKFSNLDKFSESCVLGRLVQSRQSGIFSEAALMGMGDTEYFKIEESNIDYQYDTYLNEGSFGTYITYRSQIGFQATLFSLLDRISPFSPGINLRLFKGINSLLAALAIGLLVTWIYYEFGLFTALICLLTTVMSQWLTVFGRNLYWGIWVYFLPLLAVMFLLMHQRQRADTKNWRLAIVVFIAIFLKCLLGGYDFLSTVVISAGVPIIYYAVLDAWRWSQLVKRTLIMGASALIAVLLSLAILAGQIGSITGGYREGWQHISNSVIRRTYGDPGQYPDYSASLNAKVTDVIVMYLIDDNIFRGFPLRFLEVILLFVFFTASFILFDRWKKLGMIQRNKVYALIAATWLAFVSSISTYVVFKSAAYIHTHLYFIVWHLPFTILGFALCGYVVAVIYQTLFVGSAS